MMYAIPYDADNVVLATMLSPVRDMRWATTAWAQLFGHMLWCA